MTAPFPPLPVPDGQLTIGVAAYGNVAVTAECLKAVFGSVGGSFDLILVDNGSPDNILELFHEARQFHERTRIFHFMPNREYSHSVNCILSQAQTEHVLFVSNDVFITPSYVHAVLDVMADQTIGIARGTSNFVDGILDSPLHNIPIEEEIGSLDEVETLARRVYAGSREHASPDLFLTGDVFMTRRALIDRIGGFDTGFVGYFSDIDFGIRAAHAGYRKVVCGRAFAWHAHDANLAYLPGEARQEKAQARKTRVALAWGVFREKWGLHDLPAEWEAAILGRIPYAAVEARQFDPAVDAAPAIDYAEYLVKG